MRIRPGQGVWQQCRCSGAFIRADRCETLGANWTGCNAGWILEPGYIPDGTKKETLELQINKTSLTKMAPAHASFAEHQQVLAPGNLNNTIWFKVAFSSQPQLQVTYLTSYVLFGVAELAIYNSTTISTNSNALAVYTLDARIRAIYSIPRTTVHYESQLALICVDSR